jgi:hypothetical protein
VEKQSFKQYFTAEPVRKQAKGLDLLRVKSSDRRRGQQTLHSYTFLEEKKGAI